MRAAIRILFIALVLATPALAGEKTERHPELGLIVARPTTYEARPVPAGERGMLLTYAPVDAPRDRAAPATMSVYRFALRGEPEHAIQRWALDTFRPLGLEPQRAVRERYGRTPYRYSGEVLVEGGERRALWIHGWAGPEDVVVIVGVTDGVRARRERRIWARFAESFRFIDVEADVSARTRWERYYGQRRYAHVAERVEVRMGLVDGWEARDTEHYIVLFHGASDAPLLELVSANLEILRGRFLQDFPPDGSVDSLPLVRVCRDRGEYLTYGGNPKTVGFFNPNEQELVVYDARTDATSEIPPDHPTLRTLYHEACHQFVYHSAGALSPHTWFNEGTAEFYAGARIVRGRLEGIDALEDRERYLAFEASQRELPSLAELFGMDQTAFYEDGPLHYSMGWSLVHFLRTSPRARRDARWGRILPIYFEALRRTWRQEVEELGRSGATRAAWSRAIANAQERALQEAFEGIDLDELEDAWRSEL